MWRDAWFREDETEERPDYLCETVGWLLPARSDDPFMALAAERTPDGWKAITHVPHAAMLSLLVLRSQEDEAGFRRGS